MAQGFDRILRDSTADGAKSCFQLVSVSIYHMLELGKGTVTGNPQLASKRVTAFQALAAFPSSRPLPVAVTYLAYAQMCEGGRCVSLEEFIEILDYLVSVNLLLVRHQLPHLSCQGILCGLSDSLLRLTAESIIQDLEDNDMQVDWPSLTTGCHLITRLIVQETQLGEAPSHSLFCGI